MGSLVVLLEDVVDGVVVVVAVVDQEEVMVTP
jgi:hypothetical protein